MDVHLGEIMNRDPVVVAPTTALGVAADAMQRRSVGSAVVVQQGVVRGIMTERDVARAAAAGADPRSTPVDSWMTPHPITMSPDDDVTAALEGMLDRNFRHIPVCKDGKLVGMVSLRRLVGAASIRRVDPWSPGTPRGLENVIVGTTRLSHIDGTAGRLLYVGYDAVALARRSTFEDVWHLLYTGELPSSDGFARTTSRLRSVKGAGDASYPLTRSTLDGLALRSGGMMSLVQSAIAAAGAAWGLRPWHERPAESVADEALRLAAVVPNLVASLWRLLQGLEPVAPDPDLGHAANFLWMLHGRRPNSEETLALSRYLILTAEHGMNASTFTARVIASTGADVAGAVTGAVGALSGPLHGGAPSLVLDMLDEIGTLERARGWIRDSLAGGRRLMGFGHRVYRTEDPRAACLRLTAEELGGERIALGRVVEAEALEALRAAKPGRSLYTNVEFWSAVVLERAGIPRALFTPTFAVARVIGWTAHILEQVRDNRLIRPTVEYVGPPARELPRGGNDGG